MANTIQNVIQGALATQLAHPDDKQAAAHIASRHYVCHFECPAAGDYEILVDVPQCDITITAAYIVPSLTSAANATNYVSAALGSGDLAEGTITAFDTLTTASTALTQQLKRSFSIVPSTDVVAAGTGLYLTMTNAAAGVLSAGTLIVEYEHTN